MQPNMRFRGVIFLPIAIGLLTAACTVRVDSEQRIAREEKRFTISGEPQLHISTFDGAVEVRSWDRNEVLVEIEKRGHDEDSLKSIEVKAEQQGNRIDVDVRRPAGGDTFVGIGIHVSTTANITVTVPRKLSLVARSGDGNIRVSRIDGRIELHTSDGSVRVGGLTGELDVETGDGSVTVDDLDGDATLDTSDGGVTLSGKLAKVRVKTGDGSVTVRADRGSAMGSDWSITTEDGSVAVYLPDSFNADVDAQTGDGRVRTELDVKGTVEAENHRSLRGKIGQGGQLLRIRTGDGSINLRSW
jgi:DUF4097 and DUF4098 domain-containing protein YvlB